MTDTAPQTPYDVVPYPHYPHRHAHPRHLEAMAALLGLQSPPICSARVLELGCAAGSNLIPQAIDLPGSTFLGIDLSGRQIAEGQASISELGMDNIELRQANILDIDESWGEFDYILCHGVFSWVPPQVQDKILDVCKHNLTSAGVAIVSYNTYPGWHMKAIIRDLMCYHASQFTDPGEQMVQAVAILRFLADFGDAGTSFGALLQEELTSIRKSPNGAYLFHDHLEAHNIALYFHEFADRASARGLQYLAEAEFRRMLVRNLPEKAQEPLRRLSMLQQEQYMDYLRCSRFRSTLLCHDHVALDRQVTPARMEPFSFRFSALPTMSDVDIRGDKPAVFESSVAKLQVSVPVVKAAFVCLRENFPSYVSLDALAAAARDRAAQATSHDIDHPTAVAQVSAALLMGLSVGAIEHCVHPPRCVARISAHPKASPYVRHQVWATDQVTNQLHQIIRLDGLHRHVVRRLDGAHDRASLAGSVREAVASGELVVRAGDRPIKSLDPQTASKLVDAALTTLSQSALLVE